MFARVFALGLLTFLLSGASCTPVPAVRSVGTVPYALGNSAIDWNGVWCVRRTRDCLVVSVLDPDAGTLAVRWIGPAGDREVPPNTAVLSVRRCKAEEKWLFVNEADSTQADRYLWALLHRYDRDLLGVWYTDVALSKFKLMVDRQELPGRRIKGEGLSNVWGKVSYELLLDDLSDAQCEFIVSRRQNLFDTDPMLFERLGPTFRGFED